VIVELPAALRGHAGGRARVTLEAATVREALEELTRAHPALRPALFQADGKLKRAVGVFCGEDDVRDNESRSLERDEVLVLVAAVAGG
jgi:adenylyltransferase/sulfurtransferase